MTRVTYGDLLPKIKGALLTLENNEKIAKSVIGENEQMEIRLKTLVSLYKLKERKNILDDYKLSIKDIFEIEQLMAFVSNNQKDVTYNVLPKNMIKRTTEVNTVCELDFSKLVVKKDEIKGLEVHNIDPFLYDRKFSEERFSLIQVSFDDFFEKANNNSLDLSSLGMGADLIRVSSTLSIADMTNIFERQSSNIRKILSSKITEEKEWLKPKTSYRSLNMKLSEENKKNWREKYLDGLLGKSLEAEKKSNLIRTIEENFDYSIRSYITAKLEYSILFEREEYFNLFIKGIRDKKFPTKGILEIMSYYRDIYKLSMEYYKKPTHYGEPRHNYAASLENSIINHFKINKDLENEELKKAIERYSEYMLANILATEEQPVSKINFLKYVEEVFSDEQKQKVQDKFPEIFLKEENKDWFYFEYDQSLLKFSIDEGFFLLNKVDIESSRLNTLFKIWTKTDTENLPQEIIFNVNKERVFMYATQTEKFKLLTDNQKNNVLISVFDAIISVHNNEELKLDSELSQALNLELKEISTLIAIKNVKKEASTLIKEKKKI